MAGTEGGRLADNIAHFARLLRRAGLAVGPAAVLDAIRAVEIAGLATREDLYWALHAIFVKRHEQHAVFDQAFRLFWQSSKHLREMLRPATVPDDDEEAMPRQRAAARRVAEALLPPGPPPPTPDGRKVEIEARLAASSEEAFRRRDFAAMSAAEIAEAERQIAHLHLPEDRIRTRRSFAARPPGTADLRRTLRASLRTGGRLILLQHRRRREAVPPVVVLCDISGSMGHYTRLFLRFIHALGETRRVSAFLFGTRLTNVTRELRHRDPDEALAACSAAVSDWSGGTRITQTLHEFNRRWSRRVLGQGAIVLLFTDGLDRDGGEGLAAEMDRLHRSCRRLVWLNPLLSFEGFSARARGIRAMLPHVDEFRPIHSLDSIADLCKALDEDAPAEDPRRWLGAA